MYIGKNDEKHFLTMVTRFSIKLNFFKVNNFSEKKITSKHTNKNDAI